MKPARAALLSAALGLSAVPASADDKGNAAAAAQNQSAELQAQTEARQQEIEKLRTAQGKKKPMPEHLVNKIGQMPDDKYNEFKNAVENGNQAGGLMGGSTLGWLYHATMGGGDGDRHGRGNHFGMGHKIGNGIEDGFATGGPRANDVDKTTLQSIPRDHPAYDSAQVTLASQNQNQGRHAEALSGYEGVISRGNAAPQTYAYASLSALNTGEPRKAVTYSLKSLEMDPTGPMAEQATAINRLAVKRLPKEEDPKAPIRGSDPQAPSPTPARSPAPAAAAAAASIPELERPLQPRAATAGLPPEALALVADTNRLMALASKAYRAGDMKEAVKLSAQTLAKDPDDVRALQVSAAAHAKEGKWEEVRKEADRGLDLAPGYVPLLLLRSASAIHVKDWRAAKADAASVLTKEKANPTAWRFMGIAQSGLGEREESVTSLSRAQQYGDPEARRLLALARSLPPGADAADLVEMLANAADGLETASAARTAASPPPARGLKTAVVFAAAVLTGIVVGGLIFLAGRSETESS